MNSQPDTRGHANPEAPDVDGFARGHHPGKPHEFTRYSHTSYQDGKAERVMVCALNDCPVWTYEGEVVRPRRDALAILRSVLEFYADVASYVPEPRAVRPVIEDGGACARAVLPLLDSLRADAMYPRTPVDCLISELRDQFEARVAQFKAEVAQRG